MFLLIVMSAFSLCFLLIYSKFLIGGSVKAAPLDLFYGSALFSLSLSIVLLSFRVRTTHIGMIQIKHDFRHTYMWGSIIGLVGVLILSQSIKQVNAAIVGTSVLLIVPPASILYSFKQTKETVSIAVAVLGIWLTSK
jgi:hypothetical protein